MDFFERQAVAKKKTLVLFLRIIVSMLALVAAGGLGTYGIAYLVTQANDGPEHNALVSGIFVALVFFILVIGGTLHKVWRLTRLGGAEIANELGAQGIFSPQTFEQKQLFNIVQEMSIASGIPVPGIFILEDKTINAFAAGFGIHDAVIGVTQGALDHLTRDELQGVIAHEFSHILNGDTRINTAFSGLVSGLYLVTEFGRAMVRPSRRWSSSRRDGGALGYVFILLGLIGSFFAKLVQSQVSQQREYLADASAVQFTRNPDGIAMALNRIRKGPGSTIESSHRDSNRHLFFSKAD